MTEQQAPNAILRQLNATTTAPSVYDVSATTTVTIGRDPTCQIVFDSQQFGEVSRHHARIETLTQPDQGISWQICDLDSANGTYLNGQLIRGCHRLQSGDRLVLGQNGPTFIFEIHQPTTIPPSIPSPIVTQPQPTTPMAGMGIPTSPTTPPVPPSGSKKSVTLSQLLPIVSTGRDLRRKAYLIPGIFTVSFVVLMFFSIGNPIFFNMVLASYLAGGAYFFVYQLCGKRKPWWWLISAGILTILLLLSPVLTLFIVVFRGILPGSIPENPGSLSFISLFIRMFFGAGLMEELLKAIPIFLAGWIGSRLSSPRREQLGVWEPLDGILLGAASAVGFTLLETLGQYVPNVVNDAALQFGEGFGELVGLQLLIPRILGSVAGHMAYSGYFGYFIGLSILVPSSRWRILLVGYLSSSLLHALWNSVGLINLFVLTGVGIVSYAFLAAAILQARKLSPTREQNFATQFKP